MSQPSAIATTWLHHIIYFKSNTTTHSSLLGAQGHAHSCASQVASSLPWHLLSWLSVVIWTELKLLLHSNPSAQRLLVQDGSHSHCSRIHSRAAQGQWTVSSSCVFSIAFAGAGRGGFSRSKVCPSRSRRTACLKFQLQIVTKVQWFGESSC